MSGEEIPKQPHTLLSSDEFDQLQDSQHVIELRTFLVCYILEQEAATNFTLTGRRLRAALQALLDEIAYAVEACKELLAQAVRAPRAS